MKRIPSLAKFVFCLPAGAAVLAPCGAAERSSNTQLHNPPAAFGWSRLAPAERDRRRSWMSPAAKNNNLLYVSDSQASNVYVYSLPTGQLVGTLTGFNQPVGLCVDRSNNVYVANYAAANILEYAHGGTTPINTFTDAGYPWGCSVDPTTGNLAVANAFAVGSGPVSVLVYAGPSSATEYTDPSMNSFRFCGYDGQGNLYVDGVDASAFALDELPAGGSALSRLTLDQQVVWPGGVQWDGKFLAVGDSGNHIYRLIVSNGKGYAVDTDTLGGSLNIAEFWVQGKRVYAPDYTESTMLAYPYPNGKDPLWGIGGYGYPLGATVSKGTTSSSRVR